jgi:SmpA / OmlA family
MTKSETRNAAAVEAGLSNPKPEARKRMPATASSFAVRALSFRVVVVVLLAAVLTLGGCRGKRLTKANVDEVTNGMSRKQVESILGPPTSVDSTNLLVAKKVTYTYRQGDETVTIVFFNDQVSSKESNLHD